MNTIKQKIWIGIDPGSSGALAAISSENNVLLERLPKIDKIIDLSSLKMILEGYRDSCRELMVVLEKPTPIQMGGNSSNFNFGKCCGQIEGVLAGLGLKYELAHPKSWQKVIHEGVADAGNAKAKSLVIAKRLFPNVMFKTGKQKKDDENLIDALLMAEYGRRKF